MKKTYLALIVLTLAACGGGGSGSSAPPILTDVPLDGIYRASPAIVSANDVTYDYEIPEGSPAKFYGNDGRVYRTTVTGNDVSGTASIYRVNTAGHETSALTGTVTSNGALTLQFVDGPRNVVVNSQRLAAQAMPLIGRAWCTYVFFEEDAQTCAEFDVLNNISFVSPMHGSGIRAPLVNVTLTKQVEANVYEATIDWEPCDHLTGVVGFADHEDGVHDEMVINAVGGSCGYVWWVLLTTQ